MLLSQLGGGAKNMTMNQFLFVLVLVLISILIGAFIVQIAYNSLIESGFLRKDYKRLTYVEAILLWLCTHALIW